MDEFIYVGKIVNTHGLRGEVRILSNFDYLDRVFIKGMNLYLGRKKELVVINSYRHHKKFEMITLNGYNDINEVLHLKGLYVYVKEEDLNLESHEYLTKDLIDSKVIVLNKEVGVVTDVRLVGCKNKIIEIKTNEKIVLVPYHKDFISKVDKNTKKIYITPFDGMF